MRGRHLVQEERHSLVGEADADAERHAAEDERCDRGRAQRGGGRDPTFLVEEAGAGGHGGSDEEGEAGDEHRGLAAAPGVFKEKGNDKENPADYVVEDFNEAVRLISKLEKIEIV